MLNGWLEVLQNQRQQGAGGAREEVMGNGVGEMGGLQIVFHDEGVPFPGEVGEVAGRGHLPGGADDQEQVAVPGQLFGLFLGRGRDGFAEEDHVGADEATAQAI